MSEPSCQPNLPHTQKNEAGENVFNALNEAGYKIMRVVEKNANSK
jgi:hypothetical protein